MQPSPSPRRRDSLPHPCARLLLALACTAFAGAGHGLSPVEAPPGAFTRVASAANTAPVERLRTIPEDARKGVMWPPRGRIARINDKKMMLAPGVTIRDMNNRMVLPGTIRRPKKIRYTLDHLGQVKKIWISPTGEYQGRHAPTTPPQPRD